jgi:hypothetical protein
MPIRYELGIRRETRGAVVFAVESWAEIPR